LFVVVKLPSIIRQKKYISQIYFALLSVENNVRKYFVVLHSELISTFKYIRESECPASLKE